MSVTVSVCDNVRVVVGMRNAIILFGFLLLVLVLNLPTGSCRWHFASSIASGLCQCVGVFVSLRNLLQDNRFVAAHLCCILVATQDIKVSNPISAFSRMGNGVKEYDSNDVGAH